MIFRWSTQQIVGIVLLALFLAGCGAPAASHAPLPSLTAAPSTAPLVSAATLLPTDLDSTATAAPASAPTPTPIPTPMPLSIDTASSFQLIRDIRSEGYEGWLFTSDISRDTSLLASAGCEAVGSDQCSEAVFRLIEVDTGRTVRDLEYLSPAIEVIKFSPDGKVLAVAGCGTHASQVTSDNCDLPRVWLVDTTSGKVTHELKGSLGGREYLSNVTSLVFSPDGSRLYTGVVYLKRTGKGDNIIRVYDVASGALIQTIQPQVTNCTWVYLDTSPDGRFLIADVRGDCGYPNFVEWWDLKDPARPRSVAKVTHMRYHRVSPDGSRFVLLNPEDGTLTLYDLFSGEPRKLLISAGWLRVLKFDLLGDGNSLIVELPDQSDRATFLTIVDLDSGNVIREIHPEFPLNRSFFLMPDHRTLIAWASRGDTDQEISHMMLVWDTSSWQEASVPLHFGHSPWDSGFIASDPDGTRLVRTDMMNPAVSFLVWGVPSPIQSSARQALEGYLGDLSDGRYAQAALSLTLQDVPSYPFVPVYESEWLKGLVPEVDPADKGALLEVLCKSSDFPCMPVKDVVYQAQVTQDTFMFVVTFAGPDGQQAEWPLCKNEPLSQVCDHRYGTFDFYVEHLPDGSFTVLNGLPPAIELRIPPS